MHAYSKSLYRESKYDEQRQKADKELGGLMVYATDLLQTPFGFF